MQIKQEMLVALRNVTGKQKHAFKYIQKVIVSNDFINKANPMKKKSMFRYFYLDVPQDHFDSHVNVSGITGVSYMSYSIFNMSTVPFIFLMRWIQKISFHFSLFRP